MRRGIGSYGDDDEAPSGSRSKEPVAVSLFVHKVLPASLLCSEHGKNDYQNRELVAGKIIPWSLITWPDEKERERFNSFRIIAHPRPEAFTFAVPEWLAARHGLLAMTNEQKKTEAGNSRHSGKKGLI